MEDKQGRKKLRVFRKKKGVMFFTVDALMAGIIFTLTVVLLFSYILNAPKTVDTKYYIDSYIDYITSASMNDLSSNYQFIYNDPQEKNPDAMVYQKILIMKNQGYSDELIQDFVKNFTSYIVPHHVGVEYVLDGELVYAQNNLSGRINSSNVFLTTSILTFAVDENNVLYGPNITKISIWV